MKWTTPRTRRVVADTAVLTTAFLLAVVLRFDFTIPQQTLQSLGGWLAFVLIINLATLLAIWAHRHPWRFTGLREVLLVGEGMAGAMLILLALWYAAPRVPLLGEPLRLQGLSRAVIILQAVLGFVGLSSMRVLRRLFYEQRRRRSRERRGLPPRRVLLLGAGRTGRTVADELVEHPELMLRPVGFVDDRPEVQDHFVAGLPVLGTTDQLAEIVDDHQPDSALLTWDDPTGDSRRCVREEAEHFLPVRTVPALEDLLGGRVQALAPDQDFPDDSFTEPLEPEPPRVPAAKRAVDVVAGSLLAAAATPVIALLAVAAALRLRAWPFFIQDRIGLGGQHFQFPKIRTMPPDSPAYDLLPEENELPGFCRWLRRHHLDELPQLYLVPFGTMSLVGPRPKMPDDAEPTSQHYGKMRTLVPQGCTCLWQIGPQTDQPVSHSPEYDFWYLTHGSVRLDLWILWHTALHILGIGREFTLHDLPEWTTGPGWIDTDLVFGTFSQDALTRKEAVPVITPPD